MMNNIEARLAAMPADTREIVLRQLRAKQAALRHQITPQPRDGRPFPLSFAQERMWFLHQLDPDSPQYNVSVTICLTGQLDITLLQRSAALLGQRHEALRTRFDTGDKGEPLQFIETDGHLPLLITDLQQEAEAETVFYQLARQELKRPFFLQHAPLVRLHLYQLEANEARLLLVMHHIISDGWSLSILAQELATIYTALYHQQPLTLPDLPVQCADFALWQRHWLQGEPLAQLLAYWQAHLADAPPSLDLPTDRPRPAEQTFQGERLPLQIPPELQQKLQQICQQEGVTMFMLLLAGFATLLSRLTQQDDLVIGTPILNRTQAETAAIVGAFVNTIALRLHVGQTTVRHLLQHVRQVVLAGMEHQQMPFAKLVDLLHLERSLSRAPLFQVSFGFQDNPLQALQMPGLVVELLEVRHLLRDGTLPPLDTGMAMFDLTFHLSQIPAGVGGWINYNSDLFDAETIQHLGQRYLLLLEALVANLDQPLTTLPLLLPVERVQMAALKGEKRPLPSSPLLHTLFSHTAARYASKIAAKEIDRIRHSHTTFSFAEVEKRANQLAHYLQQQGVRPETLVGICVERSLDMIVGILAVLKAGGAYVPLAPDYPTERLAFMLADADISLLLTQATFKDRAPFNTTPRICLDTEWEAINDQPDTLPESTVAPHNAAYVIYTSGSTGQPKGVIVTHQNVCNLVLAQIEAFALTPQSRVLPFASFSFDAAVSEIFTTLISGATLVLAPSAQIMPGIDLHALLHEEAISVITLPPSAALTMGDAPLPHLHTLVFAGEACPWELVDRWGNGRRLLNFYGPTEATIGSCYHLVTTRLSDTVTVPIGRPIPNVNLFVVDANLQPLPPGVPGELLIGGLGVARGYLEQPQLTAERFISLPTADILFAEDGTVDADTLTVYRTGDMVRFWPAGYLEFLGRLDQQVKLHGFRIELGEIEAALRQHPCLRDAVVVLREDTPHSARLVAYLITEANQDVTLPMLRHYLQERLPHYMIPAVFVPVTQWPLTSNGKIDRAALPSPQSGRLETGTYQVAASNEVQKGLAAIWCDLLQVETVSIHENFFELGGDSIMSIQLVARAREIGIQLTPRQVFQQQTIAQLAAVANTASASSQAEQEMVTGIMPLTPIQRWFFEHSFAEPHHWNQSVMLKVTERLQRPFLEEATTALLQHHDGLRSRFVQNEGSWQQEIMPLPLNLPLSFVDLSHLPDATWERTLLSHCNRAQATLHLETGPLFTLIYFDGGEDRAGRLLFVAHHLLVDAVSWPILLADFWTVYKQLQTETAVSLPPKTTSWQQWAKQLYSYGQQLDPQEYAYWQRPLSPSTLPLDKTAPLSANIEATTQTLKVSLSKQETRALLQDVPSVYNTHIDEVLAAALLVTWQQWTGSAALLFDREGHGREPLFADSDVSRTVGWFTSLYPVWLEADDTSNLGALLLAVKEQLRRVPGKGLPYGLFRYLRHDEKNKPLSPAAISLNYLGQVTPHIDLPFAPESVGSVRATSCPRIHVVEIEVRVENGRLHLTWLYSHALHHAETIARMAGLFLATLQNIIQHCQQPEAGGISPSDFPEAALDQADLDNVLAELEGLFN